MQRQFLIRYDLNLNDLKKIDFSTLIKKALINAKTKKKFKKIKNAKKKKKKLNELIDKCENRKNLKIKQKN